MSKVLCFSVKSCIILPRRRAKMRQHQNKLNQMLKNITGSGEKTSNILYRNNGQLLSRDDFVTGIVLGYSEDDLYGAVEVVCNNILAYMGIRDIVLFEKLEDPIADILEVTGNIRDVCDDKVMLGYYKSVLSRYKEPHRPKNIVLPMLVGLTTNQHVANIFYTLYVNYLNNEPSLTRSETIITLDLFTTMEVPPVLKVADYIFNNPAWKDLIMQKYKLCLAQAISQELPNQHILYYERVKNLVTKSLSLKYGQVKNFLAITGMKKNEYDQCFLRKKIIIDDRIKLIAQETDLSLASIIYSSLIDNVIKNS